MTKACPKCNEVKPLDQFPTSKRSPTGRGSYCKVCQNIANRNWRKANPEVNSVHQRRSTLKRLYGITPEDYEQLLTEQGGNCAICGTSETGRHAHFHVDHDHETGKVRGLLCHYCNTSLGGFQDSPEILRSAINYLEVTR